MYRWSLFDLGEKKGPSQTQSQALFRAGNANCKPKDACMRCIAMLASNLLANEYAGGGKGLTVRLHQYTLVASLFIFTSEVTAR
ncbi:unnamed protein product [Fusarium graminearum]|uniref:Chromosome 2, complete genome n=1 Tax=Gibberella zeae (strain ATCC MYA-4620 / CBS 123657 / FGSC 9075 / NRRL 31084 / PH-1) TaxID=229533 RepID=A0A0E0S7K2_GIBZE|nr:hypothetical protein FG05_35372 [Fusarium graminearum]CEF79477.1 unnamed protein product [Fusarium graminearum]